MVSSITLHQRLGGRLLLAILCCGLIGCGAEGDGLGRATVRGKVSLAGEPVDGGSINFIAIEGDNPNVSGMVVDGAYEIDKKRGPVPGKYRVEIQWHKPIGPAPQGEEFDDSKPPPKTQQVIPAEYSTKSTQEVEITRGENTHDFLINS